jgi:hypothetical protein
MPLYYAVCISTHEDRDAFQEEIARSPDIVQVCLGSLQMHLDSAEKMELRLLEVCLQVTSVMCELAPDAGGERMLLGGLIPLIMKLLDRLTTSEPDFVVLQDPFLPLLKSIYFISVILTCTFAKTFSKASESTGVPVHASVWVAQALDEGLMISVIHILHLVRKSELKLGAPSSTVLFDQITSMFANIIQQVIRYLLVGSYGVYRATKRTLRSMDKEEKRLEMKAESGNKWQESLLETWDKFKKGAQAMVEQHHEFYYEIPSALCLGINVSVFRP